MDGRERVIPGIVDEDGAPLPMPYDQERWFAAWYPEVLRHRAIVRLATAGTDKASLLARQVHLELCARPGADGTLYLLNTFGWILEPRNESRSKVLPFITYPRQVELIDDWEDALATPPPSPDANEAVIKSRDVGGTWIDVGHKAKNWRFTPLWNTAIVSADYDLAANWHDPKSYFFKLRFLLARCPDWFLPEAFAGFVSRSAHARDGLLINPENGSTIAASTTTEDALRGNRLAEVTLEEAGTLDDFDAIYNSVQNVTDHTRVISSAHVRHGFGLYNLVHGKDGYTRPRVFEFRWSHIPGRDETWYRDKRATMKDDEFAREVDIDWLAGSGDTTFPRSLDMAPGHYPYTPGQQTYVSIDDGYDQDTAFSVWQSDVRRGRLRCVAAYANSEKPISFYGQLLTGELRGNWGWGEEERELAAWMREHRVFSHAVYYGDRHGDATDLSSGKSPFAVLADEFGIAVITNSDPEANNLKTRLDLINDHLGVMDFDERHGAPRVLEALQLSRKPRRRSGAQPTTEVKGVIHHGAESHFRTTVDYLLMNLKWSFRSVERTPDWAVRVAVGGSGFDPLRDRGGRRFRREEAAWTR